jgi:hypothetical protein
VYFLYPETCGVRLEDMDVLFGDSTRALGTPASNTTPAMRAESDSLLRPESPMPPLDGGASSRSPMGRHPASAAIPGLDIDPPVDVEADGKSRGGGRQGGGGGVVGGWFSRMMGRGSGSGSGSGGEYAPVGQRDD